MWSVEVKVPHGMLCKSRGMACRVCGTRMLIKFGHSCASRPRVLNSFGHWCVSTYGAGWTWCLVVVVVVATGSFTQEPHDIVVANACACLGLLELGADSA